MTLTRRELLVATAGLATLFAGCGDEVIEPRGNLVAPMLARGIGAGGTEERPQIVAA